MLKVVHYLHNQNIAHLDLKLENFLLDGNFDLRLIDYGLSVRVQGGNNQLINLNVGTPGYKAPEIYTH